MKSIRVRWSVCIFVITSLVWMLWTMLSEDLTVCDWKVSEPIGVVDYCLDGVLTATRYTGGMGNIIFELIAFIALAEQSGRKPIITHRATAKRANEVLTWFPNLRQYVSKHKYSARCGCFKQVLLSERKCCTYDTNLFKTLNETQDKTLRVKLIYTQSFKYFQTFSNEYLSSLLAATPAIEYSAEHNLFPLVEQRKIKKNVCVHARRGDFVDNGASLPSDEEFTIQALQYLLSKDEYRKADVYAMSNNPNWVTHVLNRLPNVFVANSSKLTPPNTEWEFSRRYCDCVLLTASVSTYGWWLAHLSRGQKVYYNTVFSTPGGIERELVPDDFWPRHWVPLTMRLRNIVEESVVD